MKILYATKTWEGEWKETAKRHPKADLYVVNNLPSLQDFKKRVSGEIMEAEPFSQMIQSSFSVELGMEWSKTISELGAIWYAQSHGYTHILWYECDVIPPPKEWIDAAIPLLEKYPIVSTMHNENYATYIDFAKSDNKTFFKETDFGFEDAGFSDQCYIAETETMVQIDYNTEHNIRNIYPKHGGNDFECRVAQWLASTGKRRAVLKDFVYEHIDNEQKGEAYQKMLMPTKLNLGSGDMRIVGFTNVDLYDKTADIQADICDLPIQSESIKEIVSYQVIEHIPYQNSERVFKEMARVLEPGGTAIVETPDIDYIAKDIAKTGIIKDTWIYSLVGEYYRPWDKERYDDWENCAAAIHRNPWNIKRVEAIASKYFKSIIRTEKNKVIDEPENMRLILTK